MHEAAKLNQLVAYGPAPVVCSHSIWVEPYLCWACSFTTHSAGPLATFIRSVNINKRQSDDKNTEYMTSRLSNSREEHDDSVSAEFTPKTEEAA